MVKGVKKNLSLVELGFWADQTWAFFDKFHILAALSRAQKKHNFEFTYKGMKNVKLGHAYTYAKIADKGYGIYFHHHLCLKTDVKFFKDFFCITWHQKPAALSALWLE